MISTATILSCVATLFVSLILPLLILIGFALKNRKQGILSAWLLGAAGFVVTQLIIRLPILTWLQNQSWFPDFAQSHLFAYAFYLAFTAGLFELAGRFAVAKLMHKKLTYNRSLAAGLGHGGIEAMILIGMTYVNNLIYIFMINSGTFKTLIAQTAAMGADVTQLYAIQDSLIHTTPSLFLLAGIERILAMTCHAAMSMLVCWGVHAKKLLPCLLVCLGIHTLIDLSAGISLLIGTALTQTTAYVLIYAILVAAAAVSLWITRQLHGRWTEKEVSHDPEK